MKLTKFTFIIAIVSVLAGCTTNFEDLEYEDWKPIAAVPLVYSEITIDDVLTELNHPEEVIILEDGLVALNYTGELYSFDLADVLAIDDQSFEEAVVLDGASAAAVDAATEPVDFSFPLAFDLDFSPNEIVTSEILLSQGTASISLTRLQDEGVSGLLSIDDLLDPLGNPATFNLTGTSPVGIAENFSIDLSGYTLTPTLIPPTGNQISLLAELTLTNNSSNTTSAGDFLGLDVTFENLGFTHIIGDFDNLSLAADIDTVNINLFENIQGGTFSLNEAILNLEITNSFGFPLEIDLGDVVSINQNTGADDQIFLENISLLGQEILGGSPEVASFIFDNTNSSTSSLFAPAPIDIIFDITAESNTDGNPDNSDFITNESSFDVAVDVIIPLEGYALDLLVSDTIDFSVDFDAYEEIDSLEFRLETSNGFPVDIQFQAVFLDSLSNPIDSLFLEPTFIMEAATIDVNGDVITPNPVTSYFIFDGVRADNITTADKVKFTSIFNTNDSMNDQIIRIKDDQQVDLELGVKIFGNIEL